MQQFHPTETKLEAGTTLIEASAGTGKTYLIASLFLRLIVEQDVKIGELLAVTFTEAATEELRDRIRQRLQDAASGLRRNSSQDEIVAKFLREGQRDLAVERLHLALQSFDEAQIFTIHGFCQRALNDFAFESGARFDATILPDPSGLFLQIAQDFWRKRFYVEKQTLVLAVAESCKQRPEDWVEVLHQVSTHRDITILPPQPGERFEEIHSNLLRAFDKAQSAWKSSNDEVTNILLHSADLSRAESTFRVDVVAAHLTALGGISGSVINADCLTALRAIATSKIKAGTLRHHPSPQHL